MNILIVLMIAVYGCGLEPLKPLAPLGCTDMEPVCICDSDGECEWKFACVKDED